MARLIQVIDTETHVGTGSPSDPHRLLRQFYDVNGELLMEHDAWKESQRGLQYCRGFVCAVRLLRMVYAEGVRSSLADEVKALICETWGEKALASAEHDARCAEPAWERD